MGVVEAARMQQQWLKPYGADGAGQRVKAREGGLAGGVHIERALLGHGVPAAHKHQARGKQEGAGHPADVECIAELVALRVNQQRVVEVADDDVAGPGDGDEDADGGQ